MAGFWSAWSPNQKAKTVKKETKPRRMAGSPAGLEKINKRLIDKDTRQEICSKLIK